MKMMKLMIATALATGIILGNLIESVEAREGNTYSERDENETLVLSFFNLVNETPNDRPIRDSEKSEKIGIFKGAIENYNRVTLEGGLDTGQARNKIILEQDGSAFIMDIGTRKKERVPSSALNSIRRANLESRLIKGQDVSKRLQFIKKLIEDSEISEIKNIENVINSGFQEGIIVYSVVEQDSRKVLTEFFLVADADVLDLKNFNSERAINSLAYIVEKGLLDRALTKFGLVSYVSELSQYLLEPSSNAKPRILSDDEGTVFLDQAILEF